MLIMVIEFNMTEFIFSKDGFLFFLLLFIIIFLAVKLAVRPLAKDNKKEYRDRKGYVLSQLQMMNIITLDEYKKISKSMKDNEFKKEEDTKFKELTELLEELRNRGILGEEEYKVKMERLHKRYGIDK
ncbi:hypothetical protein SAMN05444401_3781 [Clostridium amylolyticum]|uniref:Short C-terminal domain-containing protein n=2 Tax=Clostridium amylolyticum TaxID=1121298 RepID=A0A1M6LU13_9CLOT|nr:hypothetical protein SAMN05444401_3781 [Clostridium amylolyticum]